MARSDEVDALIQKMQGWKKEALANVRRLVHAAVPDMQEEIKWRKPSNPDGVIAWSHGGLIATGEVYKDKIKVTFMHGASVPDPAGVFNASLGAGTRRAVDIFEGDRVDDEGFKALVRAAVRVRAP